MLMVRTLVPSQNAMNVPSLDRQAPAVVAQKAVSAHFTDIGINTLTNSRLTCVDVRTTL